MPKTIAVLIATSAGKRNVQGYPVEGWPEYAVHRSANSNLQGWTITHIPSGRSFPYGFRTKKGAISGIIELADDIGKHIKTENPESVTKKVTRKRMKRFVQKWLEEGLLQPPRGG